LGLFIGRLGRERCFIIAPAGIPDFHLPTDLLGIAVATYRIPSDPALLVSAVGPACNQIRRAIQQVEAATGAADKSPIFTRDAALGLLIPLPERRHLENLLHGKTAAYVGNHRLREELRHLRSFGLIQNVPGRAVADLEDDLDVDLAAYVELTDRGREWAAVLSSSPL
jgi:hypothetical protein